MRQIVLDIETEKLDKPENVWVVVCRDIQTDEVATFRHIEEKENALGLVGYLSGCSLVIGHNIISFDVPVLRSFGVNIDCEVLDTLVVSRLLNYAQAGGHSLEAWGERFKFPKDLFNDFSKWSQELEDRCIQDTLLTKRLYIYLKKYIENPKWKLPIEVEHAASRLCVSLKDNGFKYNILLSNKYYKELSLKVDSLLESFKEVFPPKSKLIKSISPVQTKSGALHAKDFKWTENKDLSIYSPESPFSLFEYVPFNPNSPKQVVERLNEAGWRPTSKTKGHLEAERAGDKEKLEEYKVYGWKIDEENLATLPDNAPEPARKLAEYLLLNSRLSDLKEWEGLYNPVSGRIHGTFNPIGSWSHRKSHVRPNMANIPSLINRHGKPQPWGPEFRSLWTVEDWNVLVGCDAEGIQLRLFAHYCNDERLIKAITEGKKEDKTDIHSLNKQILDTICNSREVAKTYIYALLLGAGIHKQAEILSCTTHQASEGLRRILDFYPGWKQLKDGKLRIDAEKGYFEGLDGRLVMFPSAHHILAGYLQNGESVVMKMASILWHQQLELEGIPFKFVDDVHDEWQTETSRAYGQWVGEIQAESIKTIGERLHLNCPLAGKYSLGRNWKETH